MKPQDETIRQAEGLPLKRTAIGVATFFLAALLLDAPSLAEGAWNMEFGTVRDWCVRLTSPVARFSRACHLDAVVNFSSEIRTRYMDKADEAFPDDAMFDEEFEGERPEEEL